MSAYLFSFLGIKVLQTFQNFSKPFGIQGGGIVYRSAVPLSSELAIALRHQAKINPIDPSIYHVTIKEVLIKKIQPKIIWILSGAVTSMEP